MKLGSWICSGRTFGGYCFLFILHPLQVMHRVTSLAEQIVAVLLEVVDDKNKTSRRIAAASGRTGGSQRHRAPGQIGGQCPSLYLQRVPFPTELDHARVEEYNAVRELLLKHQ